MYACHVSAAYRPAEMGQFIGQFSSDIYSIKFDHGTVLTLAFFPTLNIILVKHQDFDKVRIE